MSGALPSDRATRASTKPASGLGHSAGIPSAGVVLCDLCVSPVGWQPIETVPMGQTVFLGSYYDSFVLRPPFEPIWQVAEGHAFEWKGSVEFSLRGRLEQPPTHWRGLFAPPPYTPSDAQREIAAQAIEARSDKTGTGLAEGESAVPAGDAS